MGTLNKITEDYQKARAKYIEANGWMAAHGGALLWGMAGVSVGIVIGKFIRC